MHQHHGSSGWGPGPCWGVGEGSWGPEPELCLEGWGRVSQVWERGACRGAAEVGCSLKCAEASDTWDF